jgi:hypothetical protein
MFSSVLPPSPVFSTGNPRLYEKETFTATFL